MKKKALDNIVRTRVLQISFLLLFMAGCSQGRFGSIFTKDTSFHSQWNPGINRIWIGPDYWANRLQDWRVANGRLECVAAQPQRNVHIITRELSENKGSFTISSEMAVANKQALKSPKGWLGFWVGVRGRFHDYRDSAIHGKGFDVGIDTTGRLFIAHKKATDSQGPISASQLTKGIVLQLHAQPQKAGNNYVLTLKAINPVNGQVLQKVQSKKITANQLIGNIALVSSLPPVRRAIRKSTITTPDIVYSWFNNLNISGTKIAAYPEHKFGPILWAQYTQSNRIMKMTAQMPPIGPDDSHTVALQIKPAGAIKWKTIDHAPIDSLSRTATFRETNWDNMHDIAYRLVYNMQVARHRYKKCYFTGTVRKEPFDKDNIVIASFTGNNDLGFPNDDVVKYVMYHKPDILFFSGDQIYEGVGDYGIQRSPLDKACLDYLRKWYLYGWEYKNIIRNRPTISIPDDHDSYHGNLWGCSGKATDKGLTGVEAQDSGGYKMPAAWVNMMQRTQTSHLPDPYDATPEKQGISVYYCNMNYGGISFAILEDRNFKSAPKPLLPQAKIWNGWPQNPNFNAATEADVPGATLLGPRQLKFLDHWAQDWSHGIWMKVALSQTVFSNVDTLPRTEHADNNVPAIPIPAPGVYPANEKFVSDFDSGGWPQTGRNKAIKAMRKAFAFHISGDQHLGTVTQYGVDTWRDGGYAFCVPAISNIWPRRWFPPHPGLNHKPGMPRYTGDYQDGFGNKFTVYAAANPCKTGMKPATLYDRDPGYGIVKFNRKTRNITIECWPRWVDPSKPGAKEYKGWPITINMLDNYSPKPYGYLPTIKVSGMNNPVVQVINHTDNNEVVYTLRINGDTFTPAVYKPGSYTVKVGQLGTARMKVFRNLNVTKTKGAKTIKVMF